MTDFVVREGSLPLIFRNLPLFNSKRRPDLIYKIKDIHIHMLPIAGLAAGPNGMTFVCGQSWVTGGVLQGNKSIFFDF